MNYGCPHIDAQSGACLRRRLPECRPAEPGCVLHGKAALAAAPPARPRRVNHGSRRPG